MRGRVPQNGASVLHSVLHVNAYKYRRCHGFLLTERGKWECAHLLVKANITLRQCIHFGTIAPRMRATLIIQRLRCARLGVQRQREQDGLLYDEHYLVRSSNAILWIDSVTQVPVTSVPVTEIHFSHFI